MIVYWDIETYSQCSLKERGAHIYASDPTTGIHFFCYAIDDNTLLVSTNPDREPGLRPTSGVSVRLSGRARAALRSTRLALPQGSCSTPSDAETVASTDREETQKA